LNLSEASDRFSEDIDLFLDPNAFIPPIKNKKVDENLKRIEELVGEYKNQCRILCYRAYPEWEEIESLFIELRDIL
jgi:hypothetical protein